MGGVYRAREAPHHDRSVNIPAHGMVAALVMSRGRGHVPLSSAPSGRALPRREPAQRPVKCHQIERPPDDLVCPLGAVARLTLGIGSRADHDRHFGASSPDVADQGCPVTIQEREVDKDHVRRESLAHDLGVRAPAGRHRHEASGQQVVAEEPAEVRLVLDEQDEPTRSGRGARSVARPGAALTTHRPIASTAVIIHDQRVVSTPTIWRTDRITSQTSASVMRG
jgi:hypothetical protein